MIENYPTKVNEPDPAMTIFNIQDIDNKYIVTLYDLETFKEYPGQCVVTHEGEIIFSDFSRDMTNTILEELNVSSY